MIGAEDCARPLRRVRRSGVRLLVPAALCLALAGCIGETTQGAFGFFSDKAVQSTDTAQKTARAKPEVPLMRRTELVRGKVGLEAPRGYCIDGKSMRRGLTGGFALLAACNSLTGEFSGADAEPVVMTVQVQPGLLQRDLPTAGTLAAALSPARALQKIDGDGMTLVHLDSGGDRGLPSGDPKHWRGALVINGYLVGLALYAPKDHELAGRRGLVLIHRLAENMLEASPIADYSAAAPGFKPESRRKSE